MGQENKKKVLIITYYWPPAGGAGVQRPLKFVKYLRDFGWEPIIFTCDTADFQVKLDNSLMNDIPQDIKIYKKRIWEPYSIFFKIKKNDAGPNGFKSLNKKSFLSKILLFIRSNFFFPDAKMFWIIPSYNAIQKIIKKEGGIDAIISTGPPHTTHMIALKLKAKYNIPWLADFRDPWTNIEYFGDLKLTQFVRKQHFKYEKKVLDTADAVVVVGKTMQKEYEQITNNKIEVITNGYDSSDFESKPMEIKAKFNLVHTGTLRDTQNHEAFWEALHELSLEVDGFNDDLEIHFYGFTDTSVLDSATNLGLEKNVYIHEYVDHHKIVNIQQESLILLLIINKLDNPNRIITGKIFEYLASKRPILLLGPKEGDAAEILKSVNNNYIAEFDQKGQIKAQLQDLYSAYKSQNINATTNDIEKYSRKMLTYSLSILLDRIAKKL